MSNRLFLAKDKIKVLLLEGVNQSAVDHIGGAGYTNMTRVPKALDRDALMGAAKDAHVICIRSRTHLDASFFAVADKLISLALNVCVLRIRAGNEDVGGFQRHVRTIGVSVLKCHVNSLRTRMDGSRATPTLLAS